MSLQHSSGLSTRYSRFAEQEAHGRSSLYEALAHGVAADQDVIRFLMQLPPHKQQPNLLFAAVRHLFGTPADWHDFRHTILANADAVRSVMLTRATQTNEPGRCATLLPVLARLPQPLALIEVGASAGLCLLPDLYGYDYNGYRLRPDRADPGYPVFACSASPTTPLPQAMPRIVWRAGLDLNPLDVASPTDAEWLRTLVWPEQTSRLANLQAALHLAATHRPRIVKADLLGDELARLCHAAPSGATRVVFHTAVLSYVEDRAARRAFTERVRGDCDYWIANESPRTFPDLVNEATRTDPSGRFLLMVNGVAQAWTDPHGAAIEWIAGS